MDFTEFYQLLFIGSILFLLYHLFFFLYRFVRRVRYKIETEYTINTVGRVLIWITLSIFLTYLI